MNILYQIFIAPLEAVMQVVLSGSYAATGHYGVSLLVLSLCVSLAILPLYHLAEKWQQAERRAQSRLQPKLREFRQAFSGEERFMMIRTLYRQAGYHPIYALRTSVGFLIQVPFFIAAYHFLSHYEPLNGVSFFIFEDLGKPDALLWGVNVMPFVMTGVNLLAVLVYAQKLTSSDTIQLWMISVLFLVLLYTAPVALVLYWTCNNIFSLIKNLVYAKLAPTLDVKPGQRDTAFSAFQEHLVSSTRVFLKHVGKLSTPAWFRAALFLLFLDRMYYYYQSGDQSAWDASLALKECIVILVYLCITSLPRLVDSFRHTWQIYFKAVLLTFLCVAMTAFAIDWTLGIHALLERVYIKEALAVSLFLILLVFTLRLETTLSPPQHAVLLVSSSVLAAIFLFFNPLFVYASSPDRIGLLTSSHVVSFLLQSLCVGFFLYAVSFVIGAYFDRRISILYMTGIVWLALLAFVYGYVVTFSYGLFREDYFAEEHLIFTYAKIAAVPEVLILPLLFFCFIECSRRIRSLSWCSSA